MKYEKLAQDILELVGGKENINSVFHCVTRLRFRLKDENKAKTEEIKNLDGVVTVMKSGGQYQVVIGNHVPDVLSGKIMRRLLKEIFVSGKVSGDITGLEDPATVA